MDHSRFQQLLDSKRQENERHKQQIEYLDREIAKEKETLRIDREDSKNSNKISAEQQAWQNDYSPIKNVTQNLESIMNSGI